MVVCFVWKELYLGPLEYSNQIVDDVLVNADEHGNKWLQHLFLKMADRAPSQQKFPVKSV